MVHRQYRPNSHLFSQLLRELRQGYRWSDAYNAYIRIGVREEMGYPVSIIPAGLDIPAERWTRKEIHYLVWWKTPDGHPSDGSNIFGYFDDILRAEIGKGVVETFYIDDNARR